jgi:hypothetical protein
MDPDAPEVLLVGQGEDVQKYGARLIDQREPLPIFVKRAANEWEYKGRYVVKSSSSDAADIVRWSARAGRKDVTMVVFMQPAETERVSPQA